MKIPSAPLRTSQLRQLKKAALIQLRGRHSTSAFSRKLRYKYNQFARWESGKKRFLWTDFVSCSRVQRLPIDGVSVGFFGVKAGSWPELCERLVANRSLASVAKKLGKSRTSVGRWIAGESCPSFEEMLALMEACGIWVAEFMGELFDTKVFEPFFDYRSLSRDEKAVLNQIPTLCAVKNALALKDAGFAERMEAGAIAQRLGITPREERDALQALETLGVVERTPSGGYKAVAPLRTDNLVDRRAMKAHLLYWIRRAQRMVEALEKPCSASLFAYRTFGVSEATLQEIRAMTADFHNRVNAAIGADADEVERVASLNVQLMALDEDPSKPE